MEQLKKYKHMQRVGFILVNENDKCATFKKYTLSDEGRKNVVWVFIDKERKAVGFSTKEKGRQFTKMCYPTNLTYKEVITIAKTMKELGLDTPPDKREVTR